MDDIGPGDIVVCVNTNDLDGRCALLEGGRYIVRSVFVGWTKYGRTPGVRFRGIINGPGSNGEGGYRLDRFRPINESDSEIFREMIKIKEDA